MRRDPFHLTGANGAGKAGGRSRRAFLGDCARGTILAGLAALGAVLGLREGDRGFVEPCLKQRVCRGCGLLDGCSLPQAAATRRRIS